MGPREIAPARRIDLIDVDISVKTRFSKEMLAEIAQSKSPAAQYLVKYTDEFYYMWDELAAAACLALGLFTRIAALMIWIEMSVIITVFQWQNGYFWTNRGIEYALLWWLLCLAIFFRGGGRYSLDRLVGKEF